MNILIIGCGGREDAIISKLHNDDKNNSLFFCGDYENPHMRKCAKYLGKIDNIIDIAKNNGIDMAIIGPEKYLDYGFADKLEMIGVKCVGPKKKFAMIETSKIFCRNFMIANNMSKWCPKFKEIRNNSDNWHTLGNYDEIVVKADGLCSGKGVKIGGEHIKNDKEFDDLCKWYIDNNESFLIEKKLIGDEFSLMSFTDGTHFIHTIPIKDYKRAYDFDEGPNTGSMGSVSERGGKLDFLSDADIEECKMINELIIKSLNKEYNDVYKGIIYGSFIKTLNGIKVIEFNARFGDPECVNIIKLLNGKLLDIFLGICKGNLNEVKISFDSRASVFKYLAPKGYPYKPECNIPIKIGRWVEGKYACMIAAGIIQDDENNYIALGSRALGFIAIHNNIEVAVECSNNILSTIGGKLFFRKDIGKSIKYSDGGVDITEGNNVVNKIRKYAEKTNNTNFGDFGGVIDNTNETSLVASTDGVGTKSEFVLNTYENKIAYEMLGQDLINHCINDILVKGAKPYFFMDYFASAKINSDDVKYFVKGISKQCVKYKCVLLGGETAEMPDIYKENKSDLVGTIVGTVNKNHIINGKKMIEEGDIVIGLEAKSPHTNGYSLLRKMRNKFSDAEIKELCGTHKCYYNDVHEIEDYCNQEVPDHCGYKQLYDWPIIKGLCHITGGGLIENPPRFLPDDVKIKWKEFDLPPIFKKIKKIGGISYYEMWRTFNCGIGMLVVLSPKNYELLCNTNNDIKYTKIGKIVHQSNNSLQ